MPQREIPSAVDFFHKLCANAVSSPVRSTVAHGRIGTGPLDPDTGCLAGWDPRPGTGLEEPLHALVPEVPDHGSYRLV